MAKKRRLDDYPIFGTKDMIEGYLRILRRDSRRHWDGRYPKMKGQIPMKDIDEGHYAWLGLVAYVIAYDAIAIVKGKRTLSNAFYTATGQRRTKLALIMLWGYLTAHLFRWLPKEYDLLRRLL